MGTTNTQFWVPRLTPPASHPHDAHSPECLQRLQDGVHRLVSGGGQVGLAVAVGGGHDQGGGLCTGGGRMGGVRGRGRA